MTILKNGLNIARKGVAGARSLLGNRKVLATAAVLGFVAKARAVDPTTIDGVVDLSTSYISKGTATAVAAGVLGFGWVGYRIVKKYTKGAASS
ncbi:MAG: hypothetical protein WC205_10965 [Opitutaceae bacterium]|jgi:hypothetical protein